MVMVMDDNDYNWDWLFIAAIDDGGNKDIAIVIDEVMVIRKDQWWMTPMENGDSNCGGCQ